MDFEFLPQHDVVVVRPRGRVTVDDALGWTPRLGAHPQFRSGMHQIFDLADVEPGDVRLEEMRAGIRTLARKGPRSNALVAYVAPDDLTFGLARMFVALSELEMPRDRAVFRTVDEALAWIRSGQRARVRTALGHSAASVRDG